MNKKRMTQTFTVHAAVNVPAYCRMTVEAETAEEAQAIAMKNVNKDEPDVDSEWNSHIWQNGSWKDIAWSEAEDFRVVGVDKQEDTCQKPTNPS